MARTVLLASAAFVAGWRVARKRCLCEGYQRELVNAHRETRDYQNIARDLIHRYERPTP
jgi:hypothetical protein